MKTFACACGAKLFVANNHCASCGRLVGWCDKCHELASVESDDTCSHCGQSVRLCTNREQYGVCNGLVAGGEESQLCNCCRRTRLIPDTNIANHVAQWRLMERAKRRLLYDLRLVGFTEQQLDSDPPLAFEFKADTPTEHVITGHADGVITINLAEADPLHREQVRLQFGEPQRTVIGHLRHEFGHYWWMKQIDGQRDHPFRELFGDHTSPPYADAMPKYYQQGPPANWQKSYISEYATSHPWEDFAETAGFYLDMMAMLDTLRAQVPELSAAADAPFADQLVQYMAAGIVLNEITRTMGLIDVVPEVVSPAVTAKLEFVHRSRPS